MTFLNESNIANINKYYNVKIYINCYGQVVPPPPSFSPPPVPVKKDNFNIWDAVIERKQIKPDQVWKEPEPKKESNLDWIDDELIKELENIKYLEEPEPEQEQEDPRAGEMEFYNLEKYEEYNEAFKTNNNIEYVKEHITKVAEVGYIFCEYSCYERYYYIVTRLTSKSYFYKPLKSEKISYWRCKYDFGQSKYTYYTNKYNIDESVESCKRLTSEILSVNPDIYENGFIFERRY